jgi:hypothetical protein
MKNKIKTSILHFALCILHFELERSEKDSAHGEFIWHLPLLLPFPIYFPSPSQGEGRGWNFFSLSRKA